MKAAQTQRARLLSLLRQCGMIRARDLDRRHIDRKTLARACQQGLVKRCARGTYCIRAESPHPHARLAVACKRVPHGNICLLSALWYHGLCAQEPARIWIALEHKARLPRVADLSCQFVRYSGKAFTLGSMNATVHGLRLRVYSPMKTVADCFKYRNKIGAEVGHAAIRAALEKNQYNRQKLLRFAEICRVKKIVLAAADEAERVNKSQLQPKRDRAWLPEVLRQEVWAEPLRVVARRYGISDVALANRCRMLGFPLPGRGFWAKKAVS